MQLSFRKQHLSISAFPDIEIPQFTVIIGLNGSGKSHLLQAIANGSVLNSVVADRDIHGSGNIKLLGQDGRALDLGKAYFPYGDVNTVVEMTDTFEQSRKMLLAASRSRLEAATNDRIAEILGPEEDVWRLGASEVALRLGQADATRIEEVFAEAENSFTTPISKPLMLSSNGQLAKIQSIVRKISFKLSISPLIVGSHHVRLFAPWGDTEQFSTNVPLLLGKYRDSFVQNRLLQLRDKDFGTAFSLSDEEFVNKIGISPWDEINKTLDAFALPYEILPPSLSNFDSVTLTLRKVGTNQLFSPQNLSSGEKVLFQFAISLFNYDEYFMSVARPQILLLDEMDASLHPEMVNRWLRAVQRGLVETQGLNCIMTTHSPTTVALAPEASLFEMRDGSAGLSKISKQDALNRLTFGVPTLSINYSGRRQIFAESDTDAAIYESVYTIIKSHVNCERELNFLSTGLRNKDNREINAGCTIVKQTVDRLAELGNSSIFGIIDWDGEAVSTDRIKVIAAGERNGIENVLLDPLLVALLLMKERRLPEGLQDIDRFTGAASLGHHDLQRLIDAVQMEVFPDETERVEVFYLGGAKGYVFRAYLEADDHALEAALAKKFPLLNKWKTKGRGELVKAVVQHVISEHTSFCPVAIPAVFEAIANAPN